MEEAADQAQQHHLNFPHVSVQRAGQTVVRRERQLKAKMQEVLMLNHCLEGVKDLLGALTEQKKKQKKFERSSVIPHLYQPSRQVDSYLLFKQKRERRQRSETLDMLNRSGLV